MFTFTFFIELYKFKQQMKHNFFIISLISLFAVFLFTGCHWLDYHPYDALVSGEKNLTKKNVALIEEKLSGKKEFKFAVISDTQRWYDETERAVKEINTRGDIDFVIHCGDQSDFGVTAEFTKMRDICNKFKMPWVSIIGNHDCLGTGEDVYKRVYGDLNYSFQAGNVRFICLNTNALEYDYSEPVPDFNFMEAQMKELGNSSGSCRSVYIMHVRPFIDEFNNNVANIFGEYVRRTKGIMFCVNGHNHVLQIEDLFNDGITYYGCPNIGSRRYFVFTVKEEGFEHETVTF